MLLPVRLLALPASLLILLTSSPSSCTSQQLEWHHYLPRDARYFPEHEEVYRREIEMQRRLQKEMPLAVKKLSGDPGEKFFLDYWAFANTPDIVANPSLPALNCPVRPQRSNDFSPSILPRYFDRLSRNALSEKRDFQCYAGTFACTSISQPNACCPTGDICVQLDQTTSLGDVGCCPQGETCGDVLLDCQTGYTSCPNNPGGGCCPPGYGCLDVGCVQTATVTNQASPSPTQAGPSTTTVTSTVVVTPASGSPVTLTSTTTVIVTASPPSTYVVPTTSTDFPNTTTVTNIITTTSTRPYATTCASGFLSCASSLGGGCCFSTLRCESNMVCAPTTISGSATLVPPQRPTTDVTTSTTSATSDTGLSGCPTGFYGCSATHGGGCCQTNRQCDTFSCPTSVSTTLLSNSITAVAPTGSGISDPGNLNTGDCANGWATCAQSIGGGCCPESFSCGASSCAYVSATVTLTQGKQAPNSGPPARETSMLVLMTGVIISSMVFGFGVVL